MFIKRIQKANSVEPGNTIAFEGAMFKDFLSSMKPGKFYYPKTGVIVWRKGHLGDSKKTYFPEIDKSTFQENLWLFLKKDYDRSRYPHSRMELEFLIKEKLLYVFLYLERTSEQDMFLEVVTDEDKYV